MQNYGAIFWQKANNESEDRIIYSIYKVLDLLNDYGEELKMKNPDKTTGEITFINNYNSINNLYHNKYDSNHPLLPVSLSFFSSYDYNLSSSIGFLVGGRNPKFVNVISINLPRENFSGLKNRTNDFYNLFCDIVKIFNPFFAVIYNNSNKDVYGNLWTKKDINNYTNGRPTSVHWINYYSDEVINTIGKRKIYSLSESTQFNNGVIFRLFEEPFDAYNLHHLEKQKELNKKLGLINHK